MCRDALTFYVPGLSTLGTLANAALPDFVPVANSVNALINGVPWGAATATNTDYYKDCPGGIDH